MLLSPDPTTYEHSKTKNIELKLLWNREGDRWTSLGFAYEEGCIRSQDR